MQKGRESGRLPEAGTQRESTISELLGELAKSSAALIRDEITLAKQEVREKLSVPSRPHRNCYRSSDWSHRVNYFMCCRSHWAGRVRRCLAGSPNRWDCTRSDRRGNSFGRPPAAQTNEP